MRASIFGPKTAVVALAACGVAYCDGQKPMQNNATGTSKDSTPTLGKNPLDENFKDYVDDLRDHFHVPGIAVGIVDGEDAYTEGYGYSRLDTKDEVDADTLFYLASITKNLMAATLLHVLDSTVNSSRPLSMDTKLHEIIPDDFVLTDDYATLHATIKDIFCHRLGYPGHDMSYGEGKMTAADAVRRLRHLPMRKELREEMQYFNIGYTIVQHLVQTLTGKWVGDLQKEAFFKPLGMDSSTMMLSEALESGHTVAHGYAWDDLAETMVRQPWWEGLLVGPGGLITSVRDYTKYLKAAIEQELPMSKELQTA